MRKLRASPWIPAAPRFLSASRRRAISCAYCFSAGGAENDGFVVTGGGKAPAVKDAFSPEPSVPSGLVLATQRTHWLLDAPAAAELLAEEERVQADLYG